MKLSTLFAEKKVFSFEVFPPKEQRGLSAVEPAFAGLAQLSPDYISVTLGAAGSLSLRQTTLKAADMIQNKYQIPSVAHLPAINFSRAEVEVFLAELSQKGITRVLALRGDKSPYHQPKDDFPYAADLVSFIKEKGGFCIGAACYPETHLEAKSPQHDLLCLKEKVDAGVDYLITQLFFDNQRFYDFMEKTSHLGIEAPIQAGIMPITHYKQIEHIARLTRVHFPKPLKAILARYEHDAASLKSAGIDYAVEQITAVLEHQTVAGIHLYTMNNPRVAQAVYQRIQLAMS